MDLDPRKCMRIYVCTIMPSGRCSQWNKVTACSERIEKLTVLSEESQVTRSISPAAHLWKNQIFFMAFVCASFVLVCAEIFFVCAQLEKKLFKK